MPSPIDTLHIHQFFWGMIRSRVSSFRFPGLPDDVHFSIGYDERSPDINFHVTRNTADASNKPKIVIARIDRQEWEAVLPGLTLNLIGKMLKPLRLFPYGRRQRDYYYGVGFYPFPSSEPLDAQWTTLEASLLDALRPLSRRKGRLLELEGALESQLEAWAQQPLLTEMIEQSFRWLPRRPQQDPQGGIIVSSGYIGAAIYAQGQWYAIRQDLSFEGMLSALVEPPLASELIADTINAVTIIQKLNTYEEAAPYNRPFRLCRTLPTSIVSTP
ncbi:MAG TPA: hypothetical protein VNS58_02400 [Puia sp.]|nr:hypothetical protein [Puia sp.]